MIQRLKQRFLKKEEELTEEEERVRMETLGLMKQMLNKKQSKMNFVEKAPRKKRKETMQSKETRKGMDFILK